MVQATLFLASVVRRYQVAFAEEVGEGERGFKVSSGSVASRGNAKERRRRGARGRESGWAR